MSSEAGVAYVDVQGRFDSLNRGVDAALANIGARFTGLGGVAVAGIGVIAGAAIGAAAGLYAIGESFDDAYDTIRVGTGATGELLETLKDDFREVVQDVPTDFGTASTAIADLNTRLGLTGEPLQRISGQFLELSRLTGTDLAGNIESVTRLFGDWAIPTENQAEALDKLFRASQASGVSVDTLGQLMVRYGAPLRQLGFSFDEAAAMVAKFQKEGVNTELVMGSMRIALGKMAREGEPAAETFRRVVDEIKNAGDASTANALALELFGARAGPDMAAAIREGRFELDDLVGTISGGSETIAKASEDTADFSEKFTMLKNKLLVELEPAASFVFDQLAVGMDKLPAAIAAISDFFAPLVADIEKAWPRIEAAITDIVDAVTVIWDEFGDEILSVLEASWDQIVSMIEGPLEVIRGLFDIFAGIIEGDWSRVWDGIKSIVEGVWTQITGIVGAAWSVIELTFAVVGQVVSSIWETVWNGIGTVLTTVWNATIKPIIDTISGAISGVSWVASIVALAVGGAFTTMGNLVRSAYDATIGPAVDTIVGAFRTVKRVFDDVIGGINDVLGGGSKSSIPRDVRRFLGLPGAAAGGPVQGPTIVGEEGWEIVDFPAGSHVYDHETSKRMVAGLGTQLDVTTLAPVGAATGGGQHYHLEGATIYGWDDFKNKIARASIELGQAGDLEPIGIGAGRRG